MMELAHAADPLASGPTYRVVCYRCQYHGMARGTGPRATGCPDCDFPLITATDMSPPAQMPLLSKRVFGLPGVEPTPAPPAFDPISAPMAMTVATANPGFSFWSTAAICGLAVALGVVAKAMQSVM